MKRLVSIDLETHLIQPGILAPPIVCGSIAEWTPEACKGRLYTRDEMLEGVLDLLLNPEVVLAGANIVFDFGCLCAWHPEPYRMLRAVFAAYAADRVHDVLICQALDAIAKGHLYLQPNGMPLLTARGTQTDRYSLDIVVRLALGRHDAKVNDFWKLRYALLEPLPFGLWPAEARQYPVDDGENQALVAARQLGLDGVGKPYENLGDLPAQCETDWALHLGAMWGLRTEESRVALLEARAEELHKAFLANFTEVGFYRKPREKYLLAGKIDKEAGTRDTAAVARATARAYGATGTCSNCLGSGRYRKIKEEPCRGVKEKNRFRGCVGAGCMICAGKGLAYKPGNEVVCTVCHGTGFGNLSTVPSTETGDVSTSRDTLSESGDEDLIEFAENRHEKVRGTYAPYLRQGTHAPITLEPNVIVETGRTSYRGPIQLFPRGSLGVTASGVWVPTARECFKARDGRVYGSSDYPAGELCALAQVCLWLFGYSHMADFINMTKQPGQLHTMFAAKMVGETFEAMKARVKAGDKVAKGYRQAAKPFMFGRGGGMGPAKIVLTNRKEGAGTTVAPSGRVYSGIRFCILAGGAQECGIKKVREWGRPGHEREIPPTCLACLELAEHQIAPLFFETFPEVKDYHRWVQRKIEEWQGVLPCFGPWFARKGRPHRARSVENSRNPFPSGANNGFQAYIADVTKSALRKVVRESYTDENSALFHAMTRVPCFQHDELFSELNADLAHLAGPRIGELMFEAYKEWIPDVQIEGVDTALMKWWSKEAEAVYDSTGKLIVWEPSVKAA